MSIPQTNFENNNRMSELTKNINDIFGYILLYSVIIFTALSALLGGIVVYPIYKIIKVFNKIRETCCTSAAAKAEIEAEAETKPEKKPIIDENWCNVSVKNIINFVDEVEADEVEVLNSNEVAEEAQNEVAEEEQNEVASEAQNEVASEAVVVEEVLSIRRPSEEELKEFQKEEEEDAEDEDASEADAYSPKDKYSIGHYKSKTHINDPLDFDN